MAALVAAIHSDFFTAEYNVSAWSPSTHTEQITNGFGLEFCTGLKRYKLCLKAPRDENLLTDSEVMFQTLNTLSSMHTYVTIKSD